jgi:hypothetical protein
MLNMSIPQKCKKSVWPAIYDMSPIDKAIRYFDLLSQMLIMNLCPAVPHRCKALENAQLAAALGLSLGTSGKSKTR